MDAGYQIGVRRTLPASEERLWALLRSPEGQRVWLGGVTDLEPGSRFAFADGIRGEIRVHRPWSHLRLTWQLPAWEAPSIVQVRVLAARSGATLSFHQDHLGAVSAGGDEGPLGGRGRAPHRAALSRARRDLSAPSKPA